MSVLRVKTVLHFSAHSLALVLRLFFTFLPMSAFLLSLTFSLLLSSSLVHPLTMYIAPFQIDRAKSMSGRLRQDCDLIQMSWRNGRSEGAKELE